MALATQCPHCYTSFRVANDQLKLYAGLVRCGSCQQTFNGIDHLLEPDQAPKVRPETPKKIAPNLDSSSDISTNVHVEHSDTLPPVSASPEKITEEPQEIQEELKPELESETFVHSEEVISSEDTLIDEQNDDSNKEPDKELIESHSREDIAENIAKNIAEIELEADTETEPEIVADIEYESKNIIVAAPRMTMHANDWPKLNDIDITDELGASNEPVISKQNLTELKNTLGQPSANLTIREEKAYSSENHHTRNVIEEKITSTINDNTDDAKYIEEELNTPSDTIKNELNSDLFEVNDLHNDDSTSETKLTSKSKTRPYDALMHNDADEEDALGELDELDEDFNEVKPKFVIDAEKKQKYGRWVTALYSIFTLLLIVLALGQLTYYFRNHVFAHVPQARVHLIKACKLLNCSIHLLAEKGAVTKESQELVLLSSNPQIFTLSVVLQNRSNTAQAWPMIELTLTDNRKKTLLQKVFTPKEYLDDPKDLNRGIAANIEKNIDVNFELSIPKADKYEVKLFYP